MNGNYLETLTSTERKALEPHLSVRDYPAGSCLVQQGEPFSQVILICEGYLKALACSGVGRDVITELMFEGDLLGVLDSRPSDASIICVSDVRVCCLPRSAFLAVAADHPGILVKALSFCAATLRSRREMLVGMVVENATSRTIRLLMLLARRTGRITPEGIEIPFNFTRQEFGELIGSTMETAIRVLSGFRKAGLILEGRDSLTITDPEKLARGSQLVQLSRKRSAVCA